MLRHTLHVRIFWVTLSLMLGLVLGSNGAETYNLTTGETIVGELLLASANDVGVQVKVGDGEYKRVAWATFSQDDLKRLVQNQKLQAFVEPFIEVTMEERLQRTEVKIVPPPRLELPPKKNLVSAMFSSSLGIFLILLLYAANIYAGWEVSIFRGQPAALVCGAAAVLPVIGPLIFLAMPTKVKPGEGEFAAVEGAAPATEAAAAPGTATPGSAATTAAEEDDDNPMHAKGAVHPGSLHLAREEPHKAHHPSSTFQRGQFTFNRRFFETRFPGMFGAVKRDADKDMVLVIKSARGEYIGTRITRIAANDLHLQVERAGASEEVLIPFTEIKEIQHKHKDA